MRVFVSTAQLPFRLAVEKLQLGGLWFSSQPDFSRPRIGVVGSRGASEQALAFTHRFSGRLARAGIDVVSGGALGIDDAAHAGCLDAGGSGKTWLISPSGLGVPTPPEQAPRFEQVAGNGWVVSQFPADRFPRDVSRHRMRNGTLTAFVEALVVVEAGHRSGTFNAGKHALRRGIPCLVLSGPVHSPGYAGSRELAEVRGARWIHSEDDLWDAVRLATAAASSGHGPALAPTSKALLALLAAEPRHLDWLSQQSGLTMAELAPALLTLSLEDVVREGPAGFWAIGSRNRLFP